MAIEAAVMFRRFARIACLVGIAGLLAGTAAIAQLPIPFPSQSQNIPPPSVLTGSVIPFNHGASGIWGQVYSMKRAPNGHILFMDSQNASIYDLAPGASTPSLMVGPGTGTASTNCATLEGLGNSYWNSSIAVDANNVLYVADRYGSNPFCRVPYDAAAGTWTFSSADAWQGPIEYEGTSPISPQDIAIGDDGTIYASTSGGSGSPSIYKFTVNSSGTMTKQQLIINKLEDLAASIVVDHAGNLYFTENIYPTAAADRINGIREIPANAALPILGSGSGSESSQTLLVGNSDQYLGIGGLTIDSWGNIYFSSALNSTYSGYVSGVFMIPNEGTPTAPNLVWADTMMVSPVAAGHPSLVDPRGLLWIGGGGSSNWAPAGTLAPSCDTTSTQTVDATCLSSTVTLWKPGMANLGAAATSAAAATNITAYSVNAAGNMVTLTASNSFTENEIITIAASSSDALYALNGLSFIVSGAGLSSTQFGISSTLISAGAKGSTLATAGRAQVGPVYYTFNKQTTLGSIGFAQTAGNSFVPLANNPTPDPAYTTPVPNCTAGATYPAFSPTEQNNSEYSWCTVFLQLAPQKAGTAENELQLLDSKNNVIAGSSVYVSAVGQGPAISMVGAPAVVAIGSGLNHPNQVAADFLGNSYVADSALKAIEMYTPGSTTLGTAYGSGLSGPTGVAVDGAGNVYIGDSGSVYEIPYINGLAFKQQAKIASGLGTGNLSLAADAMGDVFVADEANKQVLEIANPETTLLLQQGSPLQTLTPTTPFTGPSAIATDNAGNVWVADGNNLWEFTMPYGSPTEVTSQLKGPVTGLAVDPSGSVFVADASGIYWIPYQVTSTSAGLSINNKVQVGTSLGPNNSAPISVSLDGFENLFADYGSGASSAGLAQLGMGGSMSFNAGGQEVNPDVPLESDVQLFNVGNAPLTLSAFSGDVTSGANASYFTVGAAGVLTPACGPSEFAQPGFSCYLGLNVLALAASPAGSPFTGSANVQSNATNAPAGMNIAMQANVIQDLRPASSLAIAIAPDTTDTGCAGQTYPGCQTIQVTVTSSNPGYGTPSGLITLTVPGSGPAQSSQSQSLSSSGAVKFTLTNLSGGPYNVLAVYSGAGTAGSTQNTCSSSSTPASCFAGTAGKTTFTINPATPNFSVGPPGTKGCMTNTGACTPNSTNVQVYLGNTYVNVAKDNWITATVTSTVGTPTGSVSFLLSGKPADSTQPQSSLNSSGAANFSLVNLPNGVYALTAVYNGDQNYASQSITLASFEVIAPSLQITATPSTLTTSAGTSQIATLTLQPLLGYNTDVSLQCVGSSLPSYTECTFAYPNSGLGTVSFASCPATNLNCVLPPSTLVVTLSTNVPVNGGTALLAWQRPWMLAGLFGLGLMGLIARRKKFNSYLALICLAVTMSSLSAGIAGCTNAGYSTPPPAPKVTTKSGTYNVQIIAYDPTSKLQVSLSTPSFTLPFTIQ